MKANRATVVFLWTLTLLALFFCYLLVAPFLKSVAFAAVVAVLFYPVHARLRSRIRNRNLAALLSTVIIALFITLGSLLLSRAIISGLQDTYQALRGLGDNKEQLIPFIVHSFDRATVWASRYVPISASDLQDAVLSQTEQAASGLIRVTTTVVSRVSAFALNTFVAILVLFFLFRDGRSLLRRIAVILPLKPEQRRRLFLSIKNTLHAIVYGTLTMATIQGSLTGLALWLLGITSPVVWGIAATILAMLPVVGTACVWLPASLMLFVGGHSVKAAILFVWGIAVVNPIDNILRPYLIGGRAKLPTILMFFAVIGGLKAFGGAGLLVGPMILAITIALLSFTREESHAARSIPHFGDNNGERARR